MIILKGGLILSGDNLIPKDIMIENGKIIRVEDSIDVCGEVIDVSGCWIMPGAIDVHTHLREPGYEYKETIASGTLSAAKGGITTLMSMPNLNPVPDCAEALKVQQSIIDKDAVVNVYPFASVTCGERGEKLADLEGLIGKVKGFSDDGVCVNSESLLAEAMDILKNHSIISSHCEAKGYDEEESEWRAVESELKVLSAHPAKYHFCHLSTLKSFNLVRAARQSGLDVTCEVMPHHLFLEEKDINGTNYKMNPPLRSHKDRLATIAALLDGTASIIATDHAPHSESDKAKEYSKAPNGIIGFETLLPLVYTNLIKSGMATYRDMLNWVVYNPAKRFNLPCSYIETGSVADIAVLDINNAHVYGSDEILSKSKNSPFIGKKLYGFNILTLVSGKVIYKK